MLFIIKLWWRFRGQSSSRTGGAQSPDFPGAGEDRRLEARPQRDPSCLQRNFNVRSVTSIWLPLIFPFGIDSTVNACNQFRDARGDVVNTCTTISNVRRRVVNTRAIASGLQSGGDTGKAIGHFRIALKITPSSDWHDQLFWIDYALLERFVGDGKFCNADAYTECSGPRGINDPYGSGPGAKYLQPLCWSKQCRLKEAKPGASAYSRSVRGSGKQ